MSNSDYTRAFLECLAPGEQTHTFQTFHDVAKDQPGAVVHGSISDLAPYLAAQQQQGHGVFWTVNRTNGLGREQHDITAIRCVWLDMDDPATPIAPVVAALEPHAIVESSPGKHHLYWRVDDLAVHDAQAMLRALRMRWGGDSGATGINRVLRLPGFYHLKQPAQPHMTRIVSWRPDLGPYQVAHLTYYLLGGQTPEQINADDLDDTLQPVVEGWRNTLTDAELQGRLNGQIKVNLSAHAAFGGERWTLHELWSPDMHALQAAEERSHARMSLLTRLMFLTGGDTERVHELVKDHPLAVKDGRQNLLLKELAKARRTFMTWWEPEYARRQQQREETRQLGEGIAPGAVVTPRVMTLDQMLDGLCYVGRGKGVVVRDTKQVFKYDDALGYFAASRTEVPSEVEGKTKHVNSLGLWLSHPEQRKTVGLMTWRPSEHEFCEPMDMVDGHATAYNTWRGFKPTSAPENWQDWAGWFSYHVAYLVPVEQERRRFMQWLAHIVQRPGELPHTAYLMVTRTTGTGRNWLASVLARVLQGYCALGVSLGPILDGKFNGILSQKLLATVDEVREGMDGDRYARGEALKKLITEERRQIDHKYGLQLVEQNCARWLIFSNHESDALPFDNTDRRLNVIQNPSHRQPEDYYATLYSLLSQPAFINSVRHLLESTSLEGFNAGAPAVLNEAKQAMIDGMTGVIDKAVESFKQSWGASVATFNDLTAHVQTMSGEKPKAGSVRYAMRRAQIAQHGELVQIDGRDELVIFWGEPVNDPITAVKAARGRKAFG